MIMMDNDNDDDGFMIASDLRASSREGGPEERMHQGVDGHVHHKQTSEVKVGCFQSILNTFKFDFEH